MGENARLKFIARCMAIAVCTRNRNWDEEEYRNGVIVPYKKVQKLHEELEAASAEPTVSQTKEAFFMLKSVFATKGTHIEEQMERFQQLLDETGLHSLFGDMEPFAEKTDRG
ncbi:MAG TPA: hypothetical protein VHP38_10815 [Ruminiclostridium sp.]|nr:hypothetical protein [Ruminiclostridium sp.]